MSKINLTQTLNKLVSGIQESSPKILMAVGISGMIGTTIMAVKATPKALKLIEERETEEDAKLSAGQKVATAWKCYIPAAAVCAASTACLIFSNCENSRRQAALLAAYTISDNTLREYKDKVVEVVGNKKAEAVQTAVDKEKIEKNPPVKEQIIITRKGDSLCYEPITGRYFRSDIEKVRKAVNEVNQQLMNEMSVSLNDFFYELDLQNVQIGNQLGWHLDWGLIDVGFSTQITPDGEPCLVIDYNTAPRYAFGNGGGRYF